MLNVAEYVDLLMADTLVGNEPRTIEGLRYWHIVLGAKMQ